MSDAIRSLRVRVLLLAICFATAGLAGAQSPTAVKPGFNLFTPEQDVELGRASAAEVERQIPVVRDPAVRNYVGDIGQRLAAAAPPPKFPFEFHVTNLSDVNAFALPGGFLYVNRGLIELVPTEGQLASVMAHEMAHVVLRHPTNQVSKAYLARAGVGILGGLLGGGNPTSTGIMQALGGVGLNVLFLKFSRTAEQQADVVGAQIMARAGYDPREMADMFELLRRQAGRDPGRVERFLSDHPAPADREARVRREGRRSGLSARPLRSATCRPSRRRCETCPRPSRCNRSRRPRSPADRKASRCPPRFESIRLRRVFGPSRSETDSSGSSTRTTGRPLRGGPDTA